MSRARASRLLRLIVRVDPSLNEVLARIAERLFSETRFEYSRAAIFRGLTTLGLAAVADAPRLATLFVGARLKRGRKPGVRAASRATRADRDGAR